MFMFVFWFIFWFFRFLFRVIYYFFWFLFKLVDYLTFLCEVYFLGWFFFAFFYLFFYSFIPYLFFYCIVPYFEFFVFFFLSIWDYFFLFDPFLFRFCFADLKYVYTFFLSQDYVFDLRGSICGVRSISYGIDWVHTDEHGVVMPWDKDMYVYYYIVRMWFDTDFTIFVFFVSQGVFFFGGPWVPFFFLWILNLFSVAAVLRLFPDILFGRIVKDVILDDYAYISEEEFEELYLFDQDADYEYYGSLIVKNIKMRLIAEEQEKLAKEAEILSSTDDADVISELKLAELERNVIRRVRRLQHSLFGSTFLRDYSWYHFSYDNLVGDEDTSEEKICIFSSDLNFREFRGYYFFNSQLSFDFYRVFDIDRVLFRDIISGFNYFFFFFDFFEDEDLLNVRERFSDEELRSVLDFNKPDTLSYFGFLNFLSYRNFLPIRGFQRYNLFTYLRILEFLFHLSVFGFIFYVIFFFNVYFYTFGSRFVILHWTDEAIFFVFVFCLFLFLIVVFLYSWRFFVFKCILSVLLIPYRIFIFFLFLFWDYLVFCCLFLLRFVRFDRLVFSGNSVIFFKNLVFVSIDLSIVVKSISVFFFYYTLIKWLRSVWQFGVLNWFILMYNSYMFFSLSRCNFFLFRNNLKGFSFIDFTFFWKNKMGSVTKPVSIVFVQKQVGWGNFDLVVHILQEMHFL